MKAFFHEKILSSANFDNISNFDIFLISPKKTLTSDEKDKFMIYEMVSFDEQSTANWPPLTIS